MARNKTQIYLVTYLPVKVPAVSHPSKRLVRGTLKEVESLLRGELEIRPATPEETHAMADVEIEDATGEPV